MTQASVSRGRDALLRASTATLAVLLRQWRGVEQRLDRDLRTLLEQIAGGADDPILLRRSARYPALLEQVRSLVDGYAAAAAPLITAAQRGAVAMAVGHADAQIGVAGTRLPARAVETLIGSLADGTPLADLLKTFGPEAAEAAGQALLDGVARGHGAREIAQAVRRATSVAPRRALLVARTETLRSYRSASLATYQEHADAVRGWIWLSARQAGRTCAVCWSMDGTQHALDEPFASHVACRCTPTPWLNDVSPRVETGADLFARLSDADQRRVLGPGKYALYQAGTLRLADLVAKTDGGRWGPGLRERSIREIAP